MERIRTIPLWIRELEGADAVEVGLNLEEVADIDPVKLHKRFGSVRDIYDTWSYSALYLDMNSPE